MAETFMGIRLAEALLEHGRVEQALDRLRETKETVLATGERLFEPEVHRVLGECEAGTDVERADRCFRLALEQARAHGDRALELRAATSLANLWTGDVTRHAEIRALLGGATAAFGSADSSADLRNARRILAGLA
jgi:predicted ATPase